jgi:hypothetical protein
MNSQVGAELNYLRFWSTSLSQKELTPAIHQ